LRPLFYEAIVVAQVAHRADLDIIGQRSMTPVNSETRGATPVAGVHLTSVNYYWHHQILGPKHNTGSTFLVPPFENESFSSHP
jgi:hypothetical protein